MRSSKFIPRLKYPLAIAFLPFVWAAGCDRGPRTAGAMPSAGNSPSTIAASQPVGTDVSIDNFSFNPTTITVPAGTTVTWVNHDDVPHTVTANDKAFTSKALDTDDRYSHQFTAPGTYSYFCEVHPHMTGQVIVK